LDSKRKKYKKICWGALSKRKTGERAQMRIKRMLGKESQKEVEKREG